MKTKINIVTLGCSKNLVDSEMLMTQIKANHISFVTDSNDTNAQVVIINTCGFIKDAKQESIDTILRFVDAKKKGEINHLFVMGCLAERYKKDLEHDIPEVDEYFGVNNTKDIVDRLQAFYKTELIGERYISTPKHFAYLKVSEGCNRKCSFCAIPLIRGNHVSVPMEMLVQQTQNLVNNGAKEIILIAQDLSFYGYDIYKEFKLAELIDRLSDIEGLEWLRLHYAYPANFPEKAVEVMKRKKNICNYIDVPFQHISDNMLKIMHRGYDKKDTLKMIELLRNAIPDIAIRTTMLVGHPKETAADFKELKQFISDYKFERLGVFTYSHEEDTHAYKNFDDSISEKTKEKRASELMDIQREISATLNEKKIGNTYNVIIDRKEGDYYVGRTEYDSPEVDNEVLIPSKKLSLKTGNFYNVKITSSEDFDLYGTIV